ncbi:hypothetical protein vBEcoMWL3_gp233 [Escherichia phage vB_EcoM_WL-3]|nr:hypothetical protein vBEcoMWL3_gp233 [Escherichia phage vB_EcoM_WL-3]
MKLNNQYGLASNFLSISGVKYNSLPRLEKRPII